MSQVWGAGEQWGWLSTVPALLHLDLLNGFCNPFSNSLVSEWPPKDLNAGRAYSLSIPGRTKTHHSPAAFFTKCKTSCLLSAVTQKKMNKNQGAKNILSQIFSLMMLVELTGSEWILKGSVRTWKDAAGNLHNRK